MKKFSLFKLVSVLGLTALHTLAHAQFNYQFTTLAAALGANSSSARDINNLGQVVGASHWGSPGYTSHATLWSEGTAIDLGVLTGRESSTAQAINDSGVIVGESYGNMPTRATLFQVGAGPRDLDPNGGYRDSHAMDINNHGHIVGHVEENGSPLPVDQRAVLWTEAGISNLNTTGYGSAAYGINNNGAIVGEAYRTTTSYGTAAIWRGTGTPTSISHEGVFANAINDAGLVVGYASDLGATNPTARPVIWQDDQWIELSSQSGRGFAYDVNLLGQVVGVMNRRATLWSQGQEIDLTSRLDPAVFNAGWTLEGAFGINDQGWIVGDAYNSITRQRSAYVLSITAVPEPGQAVLMLTGVVFLMALHATRRKKR